MSRRARSSLVCRSGPPDAVRSPAGFTLVELLLVIGLAAWLSAGAWAWAWTVVKAGGRDDGDAETTLAYARRTIMADVRAAEGLAPAGICDESAVCLRVPPEHRPDGEVEIVWNEDRKVVWRVAPACHVASGVESFHLVYLDAGGDVVPPMPAGAAASWRERVAGLSVEVRVRVRGSETCGRWSAWFSGRAP
jgi:prepilin-type N-terminal cleavage/methylation domain-containing protein